MVDVFIDASVLADWMILRLDYREKGKNENVITSYKEKNYRAYCSYKLIESLRTGIKGCKFYISDLSIMEVTSVIFEKNILTQMASESISLKYFWKYKNEFKLPSQAYGMIHHEIYNFYKLFIKNNKINLSNEMNYNVCKYLICKYNVDTHDAFLLSQANNKKCNYFLSNDNSLRGCIKKYRKLKVIRPETLCIELKIKL